MVLLDFTGPRALPVRVESRLFSPGLWGAMGRGACLGLRLTNPYADGGNQTVGIGADSPGHAGPEDAEIKERLSLVGFCRRALLGNACAAVKSSEILISGFRVYNAAAFALALTSLDDLFAVYRARRSCRSTAALIAVERDHAIRMTGEAVRRLGLLARIAHEVGEEAVYPLRVRTDLILENLRRTVFI